VVLLFSLPLQKILNHKRSHMELRFTWKEIRGVILIQHDYAEGMSMMIGGWSVVPSYSKVK
jgi:hypothetical protein